MAIEILPGSHLDHNLTAEHIAFALAWWNDRSTFFIDTVELPAGYSALPCGLYGPTMGDAPITDADVTYKVRNGRTCASRLIDRPVRRTRKLTVVAGPYDGRSCVLFTAYGGPAAPREPGDPDITTVEELVVSRAFWAEHALCRG